MHVCVYVDEHVNTYLWGYVYVYVHVYVYVYVNVHEHVYICVYVCESANVHVYVYVSACANVFMCTDMYVHVYIYMLYRLYTCMTYTYTQVYEHTHCDTKTGSDMSWSVASMDMSKGSMKISTAPCGSRAGALASISCRQKYQSAAPNMFLLLSVNA